MMGKLEENSKQLKSRISNLNSLVAEELEKRRICQSELAHLDNMDQEHYLEREYLSAGEITRYKNTADDLNFQIHKTVKNIKVLEDDCQRREKIFNFQLNKISAQQRGNYLIFLEKFQTLAKKFHCFGKFQKYQ